MSYLVFMYSLLNSNTFFRMVETVFSLNILSVTVLKASGSIQVWLKMTTAMATHMIQKSVDGMAVLV